MLSHKSHDCITNLPVDLAKGHNSPWLTWRCLNRLQTGEVWICDICHKQIHDRNQISIRCNRIEHWVHLRCVVIRQAQYTDTGTCHLHRESGLTTHTDITPCLQTLYPLPIDTTHTTTTQSHIQHSPGSHRIGKAQT